MKRLCCNAAKGTVRVPLIDSTRRDFQRSVAADAQLSVVTRLLGKCFQVAGKPAAQCEAARGRSALHKSHERSTCVASTTTLLVAAYRTSPKKTARSKKCFRLPTSMGADSQLPSRVTPQTAMPRQLCRQRPVFKRRRAIVDRRRLRVERGTRKLSCLDHSQLEKSSELSGGQQEYPRSSERERRAPLFEMRHRRH